MVRLREKFLRSAVAIGVAANLAAQPVLAQSEWEFNITPYAWFAGLEGDLGTVPGFPSQPVDLSFGDILDDLEYGAFLYASARNGPWVILFDGSSVKTTQTESVGGPAVDKVTVESRTSNFALALGYRVVSTAQSNVHLYAGARGWWLENDFRVKTQPATGLGTLKSDSDADWVDPLVGVSGQRSLTDRWSIYGAAEVGGFGIGADLEWSLLAGAEYAINDWFSITAAWRYLSVDYEDDGIKYDVDQSGPLLGATFRF
jgi:hypothetical protein